MKARRSRGKWLNRYRYELGELIECARAIETERDIDKLLGLILEKSRFITGADAGAFTSWRGPRGPTSAQVQAIAERFGEVRLTRVHDSPLLAIDGRRGRGARQADQHRRRVRHAAGLSVWLRPLVRRQDRLPDQERTMHAALLARERSHGVIQLINRSATRKSASTRRSASTSRW